MNTSNPTAAVAAEPKLTFPAIAHCVLKAVLVRLNECRTKCPGVGGDVDAMNVRHMIQTGLTVAAGRQAAATLAHLSKALNVHAELEITALVALCDEMEVR